jgi:outer membrane protein assembly factor BamB
VTHNEKPAKKRPNKPDASLNVSVPAGGTFLGGPERTGFFMGSFEKTPRVVWARVEPASGGSERNGGVVADDEIAVAVGSGYRCEVAALETATGKTRWRVDPPTRAKQTFAKAGNLIADGAVYFGSNQGLHALDAKHGTQRWLAKLSGICGAPIVVGETVVVGANRGLYAINRDTGRKAWTFAFDTQAAGPVAFRESTLYFSGDESLFALDATDGKTVKWKVAAFGGPALHAAPAVTSERVVFVAKNGAPACVDRVTGELQWTAQTKHSFYAHPFALSAERVVLKSIDGIIECYDLATGNQAWSSTGGRTKPRSIGHCGPIIAGTTVICMTAEHSTGTRFLSGLDLKTGKVMWELDGKPVANALADEQKRAGTSYEGTWSWYCTPFVHAGTLLAQADAGLVALR